MKNKLVFSLLIILALAVGAWAQSHSGIYKVELMPVYGSGTVLSGDVVGFSCTHDKDGDTCYVLTKHQ